jgi:hypothetical protein
MMAPLFVNVLSFVAKPAKTMHLSSTGTKQLCFLVRRYSSTAYLPTYAVVETLSEEHTCSEIP